MPNPPCHWPGTVGVFDSGVGGLSVLREIELRLPYRQLLYFADSTHVPYGERSLEEIRVFSRAIVAFLQARGACVIVVACNTASAAALYDLREHFEVPIVGMEPAVKPAVARTRSQQVGVIATQATFQGELFARLVERFAQGTTVHTQACPGLVERVEGGAASHPETEALLRQYLAPMLAAGIDSLVLGCTHYTFLRQVIQRVVGPDVEVIDPAPAVARQTRRVLTGFGATATLSQSIPEQIPHQVVYYTSGDPRAFADQVRSLVDIPGSVAGATWEDGAIVACPA